ncbi:MAG: N-acetylgalactosamine-6-sulfatase [Gemmatales bacterium]|nr:MAG: N-acetylgalactosamine-6-sulfatase [Gemmatales bacterium]
MARDDASRWSNAVAVYPVTLLAVLVALLSAAPCHGQKTERPNILIILADDQGWGDLSVHGNKNLSTPNIDSLARDGALFERFFVCPVCSPTRAEFLTGRYHPRGGVYSTSTGGERLDLDEKTIAQWFKEAGYATAAFGKWHNGMQHPYHPNARGFDEYYGFCSGHWGNYFDPVLEHNGKLVRGKGYITDDFTNHAIEFITRHKDQPFFCYVPFNTPHSPMQVPDRFYKKFANLELQCRHREPEKEDVAFTRAALAMCENIDWNVGRLLKTLEELHLAENTIVIYFSDNGPNSWRFNGGMRGRKGSTDEGGVRVPFLIRWPGKIRAGRRIPQIAAAIDLLPTLADLAGIEIKGGKPLDGISLKPLLLGNARSWPDRMIFSHWNGRVSVRTQRYRLDHTGKLYDMLNDPGQDRDISQQEKETAARLAKAVAKWKKELLTGRRKDRPFPVGYAPVTHLPARDGVPHGNIRRSGRAPNCSFFTNWRSPQDKITWDIEVAQAGTYEVTIYYTCPASDVGAQFEVAFGESQLRGKVTEAHDPPLRGKEHDRVDRGSESYVKDFKPMRVGVMELPKARGMLTLKALEVPGKQVMEVRYVVLTRR